MFAALSFVGFEAAATLGDEVREPRRIVPRAVLTSVLAGRAALRLLHLGRGRRPRHRRRRTQLTGASTPWNDLAATYASWMKWPVIIASVSSMFAVMINSSNGIVRILNTMGREGLLPRMFAFIDPKRRTPSYAIFATGAFAIVLALSVGAVSGGLGDPAGGSNVYGYLGFLLTLGILPVYVLTNLAAARYFASQRALQRDPPRRAPARRRRADGRAADRPDPRADDAPYTWFPWVIVIWVVLMAAGAWLARQRPRAARAGRRRARHRRGRAAREPVGVGDRWAA